MKNQLDKLLMQPEFDCNSTLNTLHTNRNRFSLIVNDMKTLFGRSTIVTSSHVLLIYMSKSDQ